MNLFISNPLTAALLLAVVRVTLLLSLAWLTHCLLRSRNPGWQIMIWRGTTLGIPAIMILSFLIPGWGLSFSDLDQQVGRLLPPTIAMPAEIDEPEASGSEAVATTASSASTTGNSTDSSASTILTPTSAKLAQLGPRMSIAAIVLITYALVTTLLAFRLLLQGLGLRRLMRHAAASNADVDRIRSEVCHRLKLKLEPAVLVSDAATVPFATLIPRPAIIFPRDIVTTSPASELEHLMAHECLHFAGRDLVWSMAIVLLRIVFWFHPLTWGMPEAHRFLCDVRCDLIASGRDRSGYAAMLARFALKLQQGTAPALSLAFVRGSETLRRVQRIQSQKSQAAMSRAGHIGSVLGILLLVVVVGSFGVHSLVNQPLFDVNKDELRKMSMTVHGPDGRPVAGAEISIHGLRTVKEPASAHGNRMQTKATTNEKGEVTVEYPRFVYEEMETGQLIFSVSHPDFVPFSSQGESVDNPIKVTMDAGRRVRITAKDSATGMRLTEPLFVIHPGDPSFLPWKMQEDGSLQSNALDKSLSLVMVVCLREGHPALFSDLIHLETFPEGDCRIDDVPMSPGRVVRGQLSENVPRPVINGRIGLSVASSIKEKPSYDDSLFWHDSAEIGEDGTFEFPSVPREIDIQLIANCDGWVSQSAPTEEILQRFPYVTTDEHAQSMRDGMTVAQLFSAEKAEPIVLRMEPTAICEFKVVDQSGAPVPDVTVYLSPNAAWSPGPGGIVGHYSKTSEWLGLTPEQVLTQGRAIMAQASIQFQASTNAEGIALMRNVPGKKSLSTSVHHKELDLAPNDRGNLYFRHHQVNAVPGETVQVGLTVQPKDAVVIGR
jgi:beta-lactamase regulating signal transducer with metallopeptidase domain